MDWLNGFSWQSEAGSPIYCMFVFSFFRSTVLKWCGEILMCRLRGWLLQTWWRNRNSIIYTVALVLHYTVGEKKMNSGRVLTPWKLSFMRHKRLWYYVLYQLLRVSAAFLQDGLKFAYDMPQIRFDQSTIRNVPLFKSHITLKIWSATKFLKIRIRCTGYRYPVCWATAHDSLTILSVLRLWSVMMNWCRIDLRTAQHVSWRWLRLLKVTPMYASCWYYHQLSLVA